jgi:hypothetical protein
MIYDVDLRTFVNIILYELGLCSLDRFWLADINLLRQKNTAEWLADKIKRTGCRP